MLENDMEKTEKQNPEKPSYEKLARTAQLLLDRNTALESEIGRLHMLVKDHERRLSDVMRVAAY